jgi:glycosyltransferase involved in cell wall biosynthesis
VTTASTLRIVAIGYDRHPSMRLRFQQYEAALKAEGLRVTSILIPQTDNGRPREYASVVRRNIAQADVVLVQRVLLSWLNRLLRVSKKPVVFDLDDPVHYIRPTQLETTENPRGLSDRSRVAYRRVARGSKYYSSRKRSLEQMLSLCRAAIVGNRTLDGEIALLAACPTVVLPTSVPTDHDEVKRHDSRPPVTVGWLGTRDNLFHLRTLEPAFQELGARFGEQLKLHVVTSQEYRSEFVPTEFTRWSLEQEAEIVHTFDIGIMPLVDDLYSRGKCAFKAVLCMSYGIPVVISPVGLNAELVKDGWNGFLASTPAEWAASITRLAEDHELRAELGTNAFRTIEEGFSTASAFPVLMSVLEQAGRGDPIQSRPAAELPGAAR